MKFPIEKKHKIKKKNKIKKKLINTCDFTPIINIKTHCLNINTINKEVSQLKQELQKDNINIDKNEDKTIKESKKEKGKISDKDMNENIYYIKKNKIEINCGKNENEGNINNLQTIEPKEKKIGVMHKHKNKKKK